MSPSHIKVTEGDFKLCKKHNYYLQVQGQMAVMELSYCDFGWTPCGLFVERISCNVDTVIRMYEENCAPTHAL